MATLPTGPRQWTDGEEPDNIPDADALNLDWRDNIEFLLGYTRPFIYMESNVVQNLVANTYLVQNWQVEFVKRGDITHSSNSSNIVVPVTGQYQGFFLSSIASISTLTTRISVQVLKNGTQVAVANGRPEVTTGHQQPISFSIDLTASDVVTFATRSSNSTASTVTATQNTPKVALWYAGGFS